MYVCDRCKCCYACILSTYVHRTNTEAYGVKEGKENSVVCEERVWFVIATLIN